MKIPAIILKSLTTLALTGIFSIIGITFATAINQPVLALTTETKNDPAITYLNYQLEQLIKTAAPNNQGLKYFILPESSDLKNIPADPLNPLTPEKVELGKLLFHEPALSINPINPKHWQQASCASCHLAVAGFRPNIAQGLGTGGLGWNKSRHRDPDVPSVDIDKQQILVPSNLNSAYQEAKLWDGRLGVAGLNAKEGLIQLTEVNRYKVHGLEAQAIDGFVVHKLGTAAIAQIPEYQKMFAQAFPDRPYVAAEVEDTVRAGKAIAAYERTLLANQAPFQKWLKGDKKAMSIQELRGAKVFFSSTCVQCHSGPNLANNQFSAVGFSDHPNNFSGLSLGRSAITRKENDDFKFKVPQLYNVADSSPHGHGASFNTVREIVEYFNQAEPQNLAAKYSNNLSLWFKPLNLTTEQVDDLTTFLETGLRDPDLIRYVPEKIPSGLCFPNNDPESRQQLNCS
jgi:cytochrome c peroxidase